VVGLPLHLSGRSGPEAEAARAFACALGEAAGTPVDLLDERWTTREAERALREGKRSARRKRDRGSVDSVAATLLLRSYLERERRAEGGSSG
jgi:putative Holliday junction resolvase